MNSEFELLTRRTASFSPRGRSGASNARKPVSVDPLIHFEFAVWQGATPPWPGRCVGLRLSGVPLALHSGVRPSDFGEANREESRADMIGLRSLEDRVSTGASCSDRWSVAALGEGSR